MELNKLQLGTIITITALLAGFAGEAIDFDQDKTFYCESRDIVLECHRLSSTGKTCYYANTSKRCMEGWQPLENFVDFSTGEADTFKVNANGKEWICRTENGFAGSYSKCYSGIYEGYLGELV